MKIAGMIATLFGVIFMLAEGTFQNFRNKLNYDENLERSGINQWTTDISDVPD